MAYPHVRERGKFRACAKLCQGRSFHEMTKISLATAPFQSCKICLEPLLRSRPKFAVCTRNHYTSVFVFDLSTSCVHVDRYDTKKFAFSQVYLTRSLRFCRSRSHSCCGGYEKLSSAIFKWARADPAPARSCDQRARAIRL